MKTLTYIAAFFTLLFAFNSCTKVGTPGLHLDATHATIKIGQPDSLELVGASVSDSVKWSVSPTGFNPLVSSHNHAVVSFNKSGSYLITTVFNGGASYTYAITVTTDVYNPTPTPPPSNGQATHISIAGDQITLLTHYSKSTKSDSAYVYFNAQTTNTYPCGSSSLNFTRTFDANNHLSIGFVDMYQPATKDCTASGTITSPVITFAQSFQNTFLANGTYPFSVTLNGVTYTGSVMVTATDVTFNWTYTSGVTITPMHFTR